MVNEYKIVTAFTVVRHSLILSSEATRRNVYILILETTIILSLLLTELDCLSEQSIGHSIVEIIVLDFREIFNLSEDVIVCHAICL